jgi:hypothetical protein
VADHQGGQHQGRSELTADKRTRSRVSMRTRDAHRFSP